ncbi:MAG: TadE family protein [Planctomycetota bacterium]|nr:TadE family protein [Planctomycetota bacterium]
MKICANTTRDPIASDQPDCKALPRRRHRSARKGLAPLEMVLGLPVLLMLFALMVNAGFTGVWKLRLLGASREIAWRSRDSRTNDLPNPAYQNTFWTQPDHPSETPLTTSTNGSNPLSIDDLGSYSGVRADIGSLSVDKNLLDPKRGVYEGSSNISRQLPLLPERLQPLRGSPSHHLTDNSFPFWKTHLASNIGRRTKILYGEWFDNPAFTSADTAFSDPPMRSNRGIGQIEYGGDWQNYASTVATTNGSLMNDNLLPLGSFHAKHSNQPKYMEGRYHDPEVYQWLYRGLLPNPPAFMPQIGHFISSDANAVRDQHVTPIIKKIDDDQDLLVSENESDSNLPHALAQSYISFFEDAIGLPQDYINQLQGELSAIADPIDPATQAYYDDAINAATEEKNRRKAILDPVIQQLKSYQNQF